MEKQLLTGLLGFQSYLFWARLCVSGARTGSDYENEEYEAGFQAELLLSVELVGRHCLPLCAEQQLSE